MIKIIAVGSKSSHHLPLFSKVPVDISFVHCHNGIIRRYTNHREEHRL